VTRSQAGRSLGPYTVEEELGRGGMGVVLLARQPSLDRPVVLKQVRKDLAELPELDQRFQREARTAAAIHHPNVVAVYDTFTHRGARYIAQEYVDGVDLAEVLRRAGPLPWRIAAGVALEMLRGLEEIHEQGTVHRDLKPDNVLLGRRGEVKIADFGLALDARSSSLTRPGVMLGSLPYMSPEQMRGERVDVRSDLFAFGVVLYELCAGEPPYPEPETSDGEVDTGSLLDAIRKERYPGLRRRARGVPRFLARIAQRCLRAKPSRRPDGARALRRELEVRLGETSPADLRADLAAWLWRRHVFEARDHETLVLVSAPPRHLQETRRWGLAAVLAAVLLACSLGAVRIAELPPERLGSWLAALEGGR